jgi:hypothetical protein
MLMNSHLSFIGPTGLSWIIRENLVIGNNKYSQQFRMGGRLPRVFDYIFVYQHFYVIEGPTEKVVNGDVYILDRWLV